MAICGSQISYDQLLALMINTTKTTTIFFGGRIKFIYFWCIGATMRTHIKGSSDLPCAAFKKNQSIREFIRSSLGVH